MEKMKKLTNFNSEQVREFLLTYALYIILGAIIVFVSLTTWLDPTKTPFLKVENIISIVTQASTKGILALGCAGLIVLAGTDLSIGRILGLCSVVVASLVQSFTYGSRYYPQLAEMPIFQEQGWWLLPVIALILSILIAVIVSAINGFGVAILQMHAFIITLGTSLICYGLSSLYVEGQPSGSSMSLSTFDQRFIDIALHKVVSVGPFQIPLLVVYFIALSVIMHIVWTKTRLGKNMFAVGGNMDAAAVSGVNVSRTIIGVFIMAGILYGIGSFLEAARIQSCNSSTGTNYELDAISACVIGGVSFTGGVGNIAGVVVGILLLITINFILAFLGVNAYYQYIIRGLIIVIAVAIDVRKYIARK
jgi:methyl-galactoside transport system permease protein